MIEAELAGETAMALLGVEPGTAGIPADAFGLYETLKAALQAAMRYRLIVDEDELRAVKSGVEFDGADAFHLRLEFLRPPRGTIEFRARFLELVPRNHRTSLTVVRGDDTVLGGGELEREDSVVCVELSARSDGRRTASDSDDANYSCRRQRLKGRPTSHRRYTRSGRSCSRKPTMQEKQQRQ